MRPISNDVTTPPQPEVANPGPDARHAGWGTALLAIATTVAIVVIALASPLLIDLVSMSSPGDLTDLPPPGPTPSASATWLHLVMFQTTVILLAILMADQLRGGTAARLAWQPPTPRFSWLLPFIVTAAASAAVSVVVLRYFPEILERDLELIRQMVRDGPLWLAFLCLAIGAPVSEELLFRGFLLQRLKRTPLGFWGGALIANLGWTALHFGYSWLSLTDVFVAGLLFSWALWRTGSIWVPIAFHAIYNAVVFFIMLIPEPDAVRAAMAVGTTGPLAI